MKSLFRPLSRCEAFALFFAFALTPFAQDQPAADAPKPAAENSSATAAPEPAADAPAVEAETPKSPPLRRLDSPEQNVPAESGADMIRQRAEEMKQRAEEMKQRARERSEEDRSRARERAARHTGRDVVNVFGSSFLPKGEKADSVVSIFGNTVSEGEVADGVVSIFGNNRVSGPVGDAVVAVFGNVKVDSHVGNVVAVVGNLELGPNAEVDGDVVCVAGIVKRDPGAIVHKHVQNIGGNFPFGDGFRVWVTECVLKARPLAFNRDLGWAWTIAFSLLTFYAFLALIFRGGIEKCMQTLDVQPGYSVLTAVGTVILTPVAMVLLCITVVGIVLIPFIGLGLFFAALFGNAVMLAWVGRRLTRFFGDGPLGHPAFAVLVGGAVMLVIYTVPVLGFLTYKLLGWLGLGAVVYTVLISSRREKRVVMAAAAGLPAEPPALAPSIGAVPSILSSVTLPRAGFWIRLGALALDIILMSLIAKFCSELLPRDWHIRFNPPGMLPVLAAYGALMWKLKGTTIGGIIFGLRVVRLDGREIDWATAIVRALGCFLSLVVVGLGFIWVAIDDDKQSWHDKIAGTTVVRVPKGSSLL